jgi:hypothetical protein
MRQVSSPTARLSIATVVAALAATLLVSSPARAATPSAPGNFTGWGFDACVAPSQKVMDAWNLKSPYTAIGIYVSGNSRYCGDKYQPNLSKSWVSRNAANGWKFLPIHVGYQSPCFVNNSKSRVQKKKMSKTLSTARSQGVSDAKETVAALKKYGFGPGSYSYLDLEWYSRTAACDNAVLEFSDAWTEHLHKAGYKSGVYSSGSAVIKLLDETRAKGRKGFTFPDQVWFAWTNEKADLDGGSYLRDSFWPSQRIHQYHNGVDQRFDGHTINIDKNAIKVGKGSVRFAEALPCDVPMTFSSYPKLQVGSEGPQVAALQCLLKQQGLKSTVGDGFGGGTRAGVDAFRARLGWKPTGATTRPTWTALLSAGSIPRVLKQGSTGQGVWRLQRSLRAAGLSLDVNGLYDGKTVAAVKKYREANGGYGYTTADAALWRLLQKGRTL